MLTYLKSEDIQYQLANLGQLTFEVTDACNLNCTYCGYGALYNDYDERRNSKMSINMALQLLDYLFSFWNSNYNISSEKIVYISFYGGEPLLNMKFIKEVVAYIEKSTCKTRKFVYSMTTNAILLDKYMQYLIDKKFRLLISLDGNASNTAYRVDKAGKPAFDRIISNVDLLKKTNQAYFDENVDFNAVLHDKNSVEEIYDFFKKRYNKTPTIGELNDMGIRPNQHERFVQMYRSSFQSLENASKKELIEKDMSLKCDSYQSVTTYLLRYSPFVFKNYTELIYDKPHTKKVPTGTCIPFSKKMFVTVNGKILPCERIGQQFYLGKVEGDKVVIDFDSIVERYNNYFAKLENQCKKCFNKKACVQCVFNIENIENQPICLNRMDKEDFMLYEREQLEFLRKHPEEYYNIMENVVID